MTEFQKAQRSAKPLIMGVTGASGCGKTYSALLLMRGLVGNDGRIAVIDTENGASNFYDQLTDFDVLTLTPPVTGSMYITAMQTALNAGYSGLIIDSLSHDWEHVVEHEATLPAKDMNTWTVAKQQTGHTDFFKYLFSFPLDVICTVRSDQAYEVGRDDKTGKITKVKIGLKPRQQPRFEYDFDLVFDIEMDTHVATPGGLGKNRTPIWSGERFVITERHGEILREWKLSGAEWVEPIRGSTRTEIGRYIASLGWKSGLYKKVLADAGIEYDHKVNTSEVHAQEVLAYLKTTLKNKEKTK